MVTEVAAGDSIAFVSEFNLFINFNNYFSALRIPILRLGIANALSKAFWYLVTRFAYANILITSFLA